MAKKKAWRGHKPKSEPRTSAEIRGLADELGHLSLRIHDVARDMDRLGITQLKPLTGNLENAIGKLRSIVTKEFEGKLRLEVEQLGGDVHDRMSRERD